MTRVRPLRDDDAPALRVIQSRALSDPSPALLSLATDGLLPAVVAVDTDEPVGYAFAFVDDGQAYLPELAVAPERQREGIGSALLSALCARIEARTVRLTARAGDAGVRAFYEQHGFEQVDRAADHYSDGGDGVVYERRLD